MNTQIKTILVTGGLGFIGSHFVEMILTRGYHVINVDKKTYAMRKDVPFNNHPYYQLITKDINDINNIPDTITAVVNFAAESHVDNSLNNNSPFFKTNVHGVYSLLETIRKKNKKHQPLFLHISTDEVYGDILEGSFTETDRLKPSNPYSATKAAADQLVMAWSRTYGIKTRIVRPSNNYGYGQRAEKLIPKTMKWAKKEKKMEVHGSGLYKREWTFVADNCEAIFLVLEKGVDGEIYNISSGEEYTNLDVIRKVLAVMDKPNDFYTLVPNRPCQDVRYSVNTEKIRSLGWRPQMTLDQYLPTLRLLNEERERNLPPSKKQLLLRFLGLEKILPKKI